MPPLVFPDVPQSTPGLRSQTPSGVIFPAESRVLIRHNGNKSEFERRGGGLKNKGGAVGWDERHQRRGGGQSDSGGDGHKGKDKNNNGKDGSFDKDKDKASSTSSLSTTSTSADASSGDSSITTTSFPSTASTPSDGNGESQSPFPTSLPQVSPSPAIPSPPTNSGVGPLASGNSINNTPTPPNTPTVAPISQSALAALKTPSGPPSPSASALSSTPQGNKPSVGLIAGGVAGGIFFLAVIAAAILFWRRTRKNRTAPSAEFLTVNPFNPANAPFQRLGSHNATPMRDDPPPPFTQGSYTYPILEKYPHL